MTCDELKALFPDYLADELDARKRNDIRMHLEQCETCQREFQKIEGVWNDLEGLPEESPSSELDRTEALALLGISGRLCVA